MGQKYVGLDNLVLVLSRHTAASAWSEYEWHAKYWDEVKQKQPQILPVVVDDCQIPFLLRSKRYADFRSEYAVGMAQLAVALHSSSVGKSFIGASSLEAVGEHGTTPLPLSPLTAICYDNDQMDQKGRLVEVNVELAIPYVGRIAGAWKPDEREQDAAWDMYVELVTRISVAELSPGDGLLRESLTSLYGIFTTTRHILRTYGPSVARPKEHSELSFGYLAISILNYVLRPILTKWHPLLLDYEHSRDPAVSPLRHELQWERAEELRHELNQARRLLLEYVQLLAQISRVPTVLPA